MSAFTLLGFIDCHALIGSLDKHAGLFKTIAPGHRVLHIRVPRGGEDENDPKCGWAWTTSYAKARKPVWPELRNVISRIEPGAKARLGTTIEHGRIYLEMLDANSLIGWQAGLGDYFARYVRCHLPIRTNPASALICGTEMLTHPMLGMMWGVEARLPCAAVNLGQTARVHLILDSRRSENE